MAQQESVGGKRWFFSGALNAEALPSLRFHRKCRKGGGMGGLKLEAWANHAAEASGNSASSCFLALCTSTQLVRVGRCLGLLYPGHICCLICCCKNILSTFGTGEGCSLGAHLDAH